MKKNGEIPAINYEFFRLAWRQTATGPSNLKGPPRARKKQKKPGVHLRRHLLSEKECPFGMVHFIVYMIGCEVT